MKAYTEHELEQIERADEYKDLKRNIREIGDKILAMLNEIDEERVGEREMEAARGALYRLEDVENFVRECL